MSTKAKIPTRERLLLAARRVFEREGIEGATTRAIAAEAKVCEITLFRHFGTKDRLLADLVENVLPSLGAKAAELPRTGSLKGDLLAFGTYYASVLRENFSLVRTLLGEIHHHHATQEIEVFRSIFRPLRNALVGRLEEARAKGEPLVPGDPTLLADLLNGMIFTDILRRSVPKPCPHYSTEESIATAVGLLVQAKSGRVRAG
jgi:AcrR family transcriptional regulator